MTTGLTPSRAMQGIAAALRNAHERRLPIAPVREQLGSNNVAAAYAVQGINTRHWLGAGRRLVGRKIGLTSPAVQRQLGVDQPDYGVLYADMALADGEQISRQGLIQPKVNRGEAREGRFCESIIIEGGNSIADCRDHAS